MRTEEKAEKKLYLLELLVRWNLYCYKISATSHFSAKISRKKNISLYICHSHHVNRSNRWKKKKRPKEKRITFSLAHCLDLMSMTTKASSHNAIWYSFFRFCEYFILFFFYYHFDTESILDESVCYLDIFFICNLLR